MNHRYGTMADLARELGISRSAVSKAFKKHGIQRSADGVYNLDYLAWLLTEKQEQRRSEGQRNRRGKPAGLGNLRLRREVVRLLTPIWDEAIRQTLSDHAETVTDDGAIDQDGLNSLIDFYFCASVLFNNFHQIIDREYQRDPADLDFEKPSEINFDCMENDIEAHIRALCGVENLEENRFENMPLDQLEKFLKVSSEELEREIMQ